jgi:hypothetical protein
VEQLAWFIPQNTKVQLCVEINDGRYNHIDVLRL